MADIIDLDEYRERRKFVKSERGDNSGGAPTALASIIYLPGAVQGYQPTDEHASELLQILYPSH